MPTSSSPSTSPSPTPEDIPPNLTKVGQKALHVFKTKENLAFFASCVRFFIAIPACLIISILLNDPKIGGFACLSSFMVLLADVRSKLSTRLICSVIVLAVVAASVIVGYLCSFISFGKWIVIAICGIGCGLLPVAEFFWWAVSKYFLIFLMVSLFDFAPDASALIGYLLGYVVSVLVIIIDHYMWKLNQLGTRPIEQIRDIINGTRNSWSFAIISGLILFFSLWTGDLFGLQQLAWVGIAVIYLLGTKISFGLKRSYQRVVGTALGYAAVVAIFSTPVSYNLYVLGPFIVLFATPIPYFIVKDYLMAQVCITAYILLDLEWLLKSYGGDGSLLGWRLFDTVYGAAWAVLGFILMAIVGHLEKKHQEKKEAKKAERLALGQRA